MGINDKRSFWQTKRCLLVIESFQSCLSAPLVSPSPEGICVSTTRRVPMTLWWTVLVAPGFAERQWTFDYAVRMGHAQLTVCVIIFRGLSNVRMGGLIRTHWTFVNTTSFHAAVSIFLGLISTPSNQDLIVWRHCSKVDCLNCLAKNLHLHAKWDYWYNSVIEIHEESKQLLASARIFSHQIIIITI